MPTVKMDLKANQWVEVAVPEEYNRLTVVDATGSIQIRDARSKLSDIGTRKGHFRYNEKQDKGLLQVYSTVTETGKLFYGMDEEYIPESDPMTIKDGRFIAHNVIEGMLLTGFVTEANMRGQDNTTGDSWPLSAVHPSDAVPSLSMLLAAAAIGYKRVSYSNFAREYMPDQFADIPDGVTITPAPGYRFRILSLVYSGATANSFLTGSVAGVIQGTQAVATAGVVPEQPRNFGGNGILLQVDESITPTCTAGNCTVFFVEEN